MKIDKAIEILKEKVEVDRKIRGYENPKSEYESFRERQNIAIETLIEEVEKTQKDYNNYKRGGVIII